MPDSVYLPNGLMDGGLNLFPALSFKVKATSSDRNHNWTVSEGRGFCNPTRTELKVDPEFWITRAATAQKL